MFNLLVGLTDEVAREARSALAKEGRPLLLASDASQALHLMEGRGPSIVVIGGSSTEDVAAACRLLRAAEICRGAVLVAMVLGGEDEALATLEAGADDCFRELPGGGELRSRLLVARRAASRGASHRFATESRDQFFELSIDLLCIAGFDGYFKSVNPAWTSVLGWSSVELMSRPSLDFVHPDDRDSTSAARSRLKGGDVLIGFSNRYQHKDGSYRWLDWRVKPVVGRQAVYAAARDVTESRAAKQALWEVSESLRTTLNSIGDGVIATDATGAVARMNPVAERLTRRTAAEAKGRPIAETFSVINEDTRAALDNPVDRVLHTQAVVGLPKHTLLVRADGTEVAISDSCAPIRAADGTVTGAVLIFRDLTLERESAAASARSQKQLMLADRMASVGTLAAGVAHEINNPLTYVMANLDTAIEDIRAILGSSTSGRMKDLEEMLTEAREGAGRVAKIVRELKTFSRVEEDRRGAVDVIPVLELSISMTFNEIRHRARLVKDYGKIPLVDADDARLGQVFINLLVNAAQAFSESNVAANEIRITTGTDAAGRAVVEVRDTGPGIPAALLSRIFDPFFTTKPAGVGTGLGLAICHNIVTDMGGSIAVYSEMSQGTTFRVVLPASSQIVVSELPAEPQLVSRCQPIGRVLVVDDEPAVGAALRRILRGHDLTVVTTGHEAMDILSSGVEFDVIFSDLMMPGMSGMELYDRVARLHPKMASRVVFVTGGAFTSEAHAFLDRVANERLEKPFDGRQLKEMVWKFVK